MYGEEKTTLINLTSHEQYLDILKKLKSKTSYIVLVQIDGEDKNDLNLVKALKHMELIGKKKVNGSWKHMLIDFKNRIGLFFVIV